jgi:hypothetical protein
LKEKIKICNSFVSDFRSLEANKEISEFNKFAKSLDSEIIRKKRKIRRIIKGASVVLAAGIVFGLGYILFDKLRAGLMEQGTVKNVESANINGALNSDYSIMIRLTNLIKSFLLIVGFAMLGGSAFKFFVAKSAEEKYKAKEAILSAGVFICIFWGLSFIISIVVAMAGT